ncbi:hypothetical protein D3C73_914580 [compost metagenome]
MATGSEIQAQDCVAWLQQGKENRLVGLSTRVWLNVYIAAAKQLFCPVDRCLLDDVSEIGTAMEAFPWVAFNCLVGDNRA